jgi:hypothetical protein
LSHGAESDHESRFGDFENKENDFDNFGCLKVMAATTLTRISYDFGPSGITKAHIGSMETYARYFPKGYDRGPIAESVPEPRVNEAVVFEIFFHYRAPHATTSGSCGHSAQILSATVAFDVKCYHSNW